MLGSYRRPRKSFIPLGQEPIGNGSLGLHRSRILTGATVRAPVFSGLNLLMYCASTLPAVLRLFQDFRT